MVSVWHNIVGVLVAAPQSPKIKATAVPKAELCPKSKQEKNNNRRNKVLGRWNCLRDTNVMDLICWQSCSHTLFDTCLVKMDEMEIYN